MSFGTPTEIASGQVKAAGTQLVLTASVAAAIGDLVTVRASWDNIDTAEGATNRLSVADDNGNVWEKVAEYTYSVGAAADGITVAVWKSVLTTAIAVNDDITITNTNSASAKAAVAEKWPITEAEVALDVLVQDGGASGTHVDPSIAGMATGEKLVLHVVARESANTDTFDVDADYTELGTIGTSGGGTATNANIQGSYRITTLTSDGWEDTGSTIIRDHAQLYFSLVEVAGGGTPQELNPVMAAGGDMNVGLTVGKPLAVQMDGSSTMTVGVVTPERLAMIMAGAAVMTLAFLVPKRLGGTWTSGSQFALNLQIGAVIYLKKVRMLLGFGN